MLSENSEREKITITIKKDNKRILEKVADAENRNISRQIDCLIEEHYRLAEEQLLNQIEAGKCPAEEMLTSKELREKLGINV